MLRFLVVVFAVSSDEALVLRFVVVLDFDSLFALVVFDVDLAFDFVVVSDSSSDAALVLRFVVVFVFDSLFALVVFDFDSLFDLVVFDVDLVLDFDSALVLAFDVLFALDLLFVLAVLSASLSVVFSFVFSSSAIYMLSSSVADGINKIVLSVYILGPSEPEIQERVVCAVKQICGGQHEYAEQYGEPYGRQLLLEAREDFARISG